MVGEHSQYEGGGETEGDKPGDSNNFSHLCSK